MTQYHYASMSHIYLYVVLQLMEPSRVRLWTLRTWNCNLLVIDLVPASVSASVSLLAISIATATFTKDMMLEKVIVRMDFRSMEFHHNEGYNSITWSCSRTLSRKTITNSIFSNEYYLYTDIHAVSRKETTKCDPVNNNNSIPMVLLVLDIGSNEY